MKAFNIEDIVEVQLIGDRAYIYSDNDSDVWDIPNIENMENAKEIIIEELEKRNQEIFNDNFFF